MFALLNPPLLKLRSPEAYSLQWLKIFELPRLSLGAIAIARCWSFHSKLTIMVQDKQVVGCFTRIKAKANGRDSLGVLKHLILQKKSHYVTFGKVL
ncbi:MAG: hypothetical protein QNJ65_03295 [Xenococcaceae cyanobacterium MO_234.B1]|nr:hypothetical protein [Xenococcaceae cyanobacterium MO_234.B1]